MYLAYHVISGILSGKKVFCFECGFHDITAVDFYFLFLHHYQNTF